MILLLGGVSEAGLIASLLSERGAEVLISTATDFPMNGPFPNDAEFRVGPLSLEGMTHLIRERNIKAVLDATHPYAVEVSATARRAARELGVVCFRFSRPASAENADGAHFATDHNEAAKIAFSFRKPVLLTTGSKNILPYLRIANETSVPLIVRALPSKESIAACLAAGIPRDRIIAAKGPFSLEDNLVAIQQYRIGVVVTKDSGEAGGLREKIEAARATGCELVIVSRPAENDETVFHDINEIVEAAAKSIGL